ncbi:MAG TPA: hypothetical protein VKA81_03545, partial [Verrucomicrobiae bacterium]|nr:hypothetical protein [Verrucomicrobiae bacterium]
MKALLLTCYAGIFLMGCISTAHKDETLNPQAPADLVKIDKNHGSELPIAEIEVADRIEKLVSFVNSLPQKWSVPWYGPPVGKVYFNFYKDGRAVGNFYVGS